MTALVLDAVEAKLAPFDIAMTSLLCCAGLLLTLVSTAAGADSSLVAF